MFPALMLFGGCRCTAPGAGSAWSLFDVRYLQERPASRFIILRMNTWPKIERHSSNYVLMQSEGILLDGHGGLQYALARAY